MLPDIDRASFVSVFGGVYEHSPWVAERVFDRAGDGLPCGLAQLKELFRVVLMEAGKERQLELLRAHPELGVRAAARGRLTAASREEQSGAGLGQCSEEELAEFGTLNAKYREKFGFPFVVAVKGLGKDEILRLFRRRLENEPGAEFREALEQVARIGCLRIGALLDG